MSTDPIIYSARGTVTRSNPPTEFYISGAVMIDPTLRLWHGSPSDPADPAPLPPGNNQYSYHIPGYSLCAYTMEQPRAVYHFCGTGGSLYIERTDTDLGSLEWFLEKGTGTLPKCWGEEFRFYNDDMSDYDMFNQIHILAPFIRLTYLMTQDIPNFEQPVNCDVMLAKIKRLDVFGKYKSKG